MSAAARAGCVLAVLCAVFPAAALAQQPAGSVAGADVVIGSSAVDPAHASLLVGETARWRNGSIRTHTVTSTNGVFGSDLLGPGSRYSYTFSSTGSFAYYCRIHPFIKGTVDVATLLLHAVDPVVRGEPLDLAGRGRAGGAAVTIEQDAGAGFAPLLTVDRDVDGSFVAHLTADRTATFRAVSGNDVSAPVSVEVATARTVKVTTRRGRRQRIVRVTVAPILPGSTVHLQRNLRERFGWWTLKRHSLSSAGQARFALRRGSTGRYRVMLTKPDGETPLAVSRTLRLRG